ncbi:putative succinate dehydrogenase subunit protein [Botrytis fragariae]|uniref:Succinate dehydrogenase [ubiquinone] cytochrome b small subunit n=1 Tax=Botrytis fragariae TaxID=1964551 RepID=A0A8H6AQ39_9HELO|nr:putative succinate dehydrogenase subunit protein [Botrytis fragariae]KAF5871736.1 putative succinate dehydrogenase subunit protein [Botrytis fragariae]
MASFIKPSIIRQTCLAASKRNFSTKIPSNFPAINKPAGRSTFVRDALPGSMRVAAFHASGRQSILPPLPQSIDGTSNDAAPVPKPSPSHGSYHWTFERLIAVGLVPLTVAPFVSGSLNPATDALLCAAILIHSHIGFESCIIDYFPAKRVPKTKALFWWGLRGATVLVGVGLYEFETNDVGVTEGIKRIWRA